jgi:hypothetical protein
MTRPTDQNSGNHLTSPSRPKPPPKGPSSASSPNRPTTLFREVSREVSVLSWVTLIILHWLV